MGAPITVSVSATGSTQLVAPLPKGTRRGYALIGRQDTGSGRVFLSVGSKEFTNATAALWVDAGERITLTPDEANALLMHGVWARSSSGTIDVQVQIG